MEKELISLGKPFTVFSDYKYLSYFMTKKRLTERQIRWSYTFSEYDFCLKFRLGTKSGKLDALSKREQDLSADENDERLKSRELQLIKEKWLQS
jgi:hypothetical protein